METEKISFHAWFNLTYAQFLTVPRSILEAMPLCWQWEMTSLLNELDSTFDWRPPKGQYWVTRPRDSKGQYKFDQLCNYRHPSIKYIEELRKQKENNALRQ